MGQTVPTSQSKRCENYKPHISPHILCITTTLQVNFFQTYDAYHTLTQHKGGFAQITTTQNHHTYNVDNEMSIFFARDPVTKEGTCVC